MYRRRRPQREKITFSFDSFLDLVTNVIGIIIRLILVTWVGARAYTSAMMLSQEEKPTEQAVMTALPPPRAEDDPLSKDLADARREVDRVRDRLLDQLKELDLVQSKEAGVKNDLSAVGRRLQDVDKDKQATDSILRQRGQQVRSTALTVEEMRQKAKKLQSDIQAVEKLPVPTKVLRFPVPVSKPVFSDEMFFELKGGQVSFIDVPTFMLEVKSLFETKNEALENQLMTQWKVEGKTAAVGSFRMHYFIDRQRQLGDSMDAEQEPTKSKRFGYGLSGWIIEPISPNRGESLEAALAPNSEFRQNIARLVPQLSVVTFWVYPDSFAMFRQLRDLLYENDIEVAGRPIPFDHAIAANRNGSASRGQ